MKKHTRSLLEELNSIGSARNKDLLIENRGVSLISSCVNLINLIKETYDAETAAELEKRFLNSIRTNDQRKYLRGCRKITESKKSSLTD